ncbi:Actin-related protein 6 [Orchesella cincta]|uniref:Actin-related protein 6 n=1 Tax=Orchesella cincta TaxID=48709 RepID=A0A1D2N6E8_ORCCI|nr:Actin-related protein 6 [Orchesella cincta]
MPTLILDNGGYTIKAGFSTVDKPRIIPNCISKARSERRRPFIGDQIDDCRDTSGLFFILPFQKGYMVNADTQKTIWDYCFSKDVLDVSPSETDVVITEPHFNFKSLQEAVCELLFEEYEFRALCRTSASTSADYYYSITEGASKKTLCTLVVDCGYSFTHIVPYVNGVKVTESVRRIDVGGKALTNHLKEIVSYRQLHVLDETYLINQVKEDVCYVSTDFSGDVAISKKKLSENNTIIREYVLPDYSSIRRGYVRKVEETGQRAKSTEQILRLNNERFTVPELMFHPSDVGIPQMGISEAVVTVIESFPEPLRHHFYDNIVLIGGTSCFPGFKERILQDVRRDASIYADTNVFLPQNPTTYAWEGAKKFSQDPEFSKYMVTRNTYNEKGLNAFVKICDI